MLSNAEKCTHNYSANGIRGEMFCAYVKLPCFYLFIPNIFCSVGLQRNRRNETRVNENERESFLSRQLENKCI